jgi:hypothetical protein
MIVDVSGQFIAIRDSDDVIRAKLQTNREEIEVPDSFPEDCIETVDDVKTLSQLDVSWDGRLIGHSETQ